MTASKHNGLFGHGDIVGYQGSSRFYGYKLLKQVYIEQIAEYRWIAQPGSSKEPETFDVNGPESITLLSASVINSDYSSKWVPGNKYEKGDILTGTTEDGKLVVLFYVSDAEVQRLTVSGAYSGDQGYASLEHYRSELKDLKMLKTRGITNKRFSEV
jgi:hypothetical protein